MSLALNRAVSIALVAALVSPSMKCVAAQTTNSATNPLLSPFRFRSLGPAGPGGRIDDIAVSETDPSIIILAFATGGLFKSTNNGTTFEPVFESYGSASFGDVAIHPTNPSIAYAGTGEANNRNSSSFGDGIYKTIDGGRTWKHIGLKETQTISRVVIDPRHPETVFVAANGHLFGPNPERGIYKTINGGETWDKVKFIDDNTGFTDIVIDPSNSNTLFAASYQRRRSGCCFNGGGAGAAIWKTTDAGRTWTKLSGNGLPIGTYGRIAIDIARSNPRVVYAQIEVGDLGTDNAVAAAGEDVPAGGGGRGGYDWCNNGASSIGGRGRGVNASSTEQPSAPPALDPKRSGLYRSDDGGRTWSLRSNCDDRPLYFSQVSIDPQNPNTVYVAGASASKSLDGGKTFTILGRAGGLGEPGHVDIHAVWVDPKNSNHLMLATDGGLNISWDQGRNWNQVTTISVGQSYWVSADMRRPYRVYTGMQDNGVWGGPSATRSFEGVITNAAWFGVNQNDGYQTAVDPTDYRIVYGESQNGGVVRFDLGSGIQKSIKPVAGGSAGRGAVEPGSCVDGRVASGRGGGRAGGGRGGAALGNVLNAQPGEQYRFNWNTPFSLSPHNPRIVWVGANRLFKSYDRGDTYVASPDLTKQLDRCKINLMGGAGDRPQLGKNDGVSAYSTINSLSESPAMPGVVWVGTDDGNLQISRDGGVTFTEVGKNLSGLPAGALSGDNPYWISRIDASHFDAGTAYIAVDGHRSDDLHPYVFVTNDYGKSFRSISGNLPAYGNVQVIREDPRNKDLLYVGTEFGLFTSLDAGASWTRMANGFPTVRTDDILVHPRDGDLIVATHGRGIWIADDITPLQQLLASVLDQDAYLFDIRPAVSWATDVQSNQCRPTLPCTGQSVFAAENAPRGSAITYYLKSPMAGGVTISISDIAGRVVCTSQGTGNKGLNRVQWTLAGGQPSQTGGRGGGITTQGGRCDAVTNTGSVAPGVYTVKLTVSGREHTKIVQVLEDRWLEAR